MTINGRPKFKEQAEKWRKLKINKDKNEYLYTLVHSKLNGNEEHFRKSHTACEREFDFSVTKFGEKNPTENHGFLLVIFLGYLL